MVRYLRKLLQNPFLLPLALHHRYHRVAGHDNTISVMEEDWDNLIVLDACRFDLFKSLWNGPGELTSVISRGSNTPEWLIRNFTNEYPDTVYITGNPQVQANDIQDRFYKTISVWQSDWNDELNTVLPRDMANATIKAVNEYSDKRIISHWIQPHYPFIGKTGQRLEHRSLVGNGEIKEDSDLPSIWDQLKHGNVSEDVVRSAYRENLEIALPEVYRTVERLDGKTVVTSDHGNVFGKYGLYGHPGNKFVKELIEVPWVCIDSDRREIHAGRVDPVVTTDDAVKERLQHLGYT